MILLEYKFCVSGCLSICKHLTMIRGDKNLYTPSLQGVLHLLVTVILTIIVTAFISSTPPLSWNITTAAYGNPRILVDVTRHGLLNSCAYDLRRIEW